MLNSVDVGNVYDSALKNKSKLITPPVNQIMNTKNHFLCWSEKAYSYQSF